MGSEKNLVVLKYTQTQKYLKYFIVNLYLSFLKKTFGIYKDCVYLYNLPMIRSYKHIKCTIYLFIVTFIVVEELLSLKELFQI